MSRVMLQERLSRSARNGLRRVGADSIGSRSSRWFAVPLVALVVARLLPGSGFGLWLRLAASTACLLVPAAVVAASFALPVVSATAAVGLAFLALSLGVTFALHRSLWIALAAYACLASAACVSVMVVRGRLARRSSRPGRAVVVVAVGGVCLGAALWPLAGVLSGDSLFHLARVRKLDAFGGLSLKSVDEFRDGGLHPGYAFPLWHGFLALVSRLAHVDPSAVLLHEPSILTPIAVLVAFEAGVAVFSSLVLGVAAALAQVALIALAPGHGGAYTSLALPATFARQVVVPALFALSFGRPSENATSRWQKAFHVAVVGAAAAALAFIHPTYAVFVAIALAGFVVVRACFDLRDAVKFGVALVPFGVAIAAVFAWLAPVVSQTRSHNPGCAEVMRAFANYPHEIVHGSCTRYRLAPEMVTRSGSLAVAGLVLVPLAAFAVRKRWAALVLGGTLTLLSLLLTPWLFPRFASLVSISQARRAAGFVPFTYALVGGAAVLARLTRPWVVLSVGLIAGIVLELAYPGSFRASLPPGLPSFPAWFALAAGAGALVVAACLRPSHVFWDAGRPALAAVVLFAIPVAIVGFGHWSTVSAKPGILSAGVIRLFRRPALRGSVVFSDPATSYDLAAYAPVYIVAAPPEHVANTVANDPYRRRDEAVRFLATGALAIPRRYGACSIVLRRPSRLRLHLPLVYRDSSFLVYALQPEWPRCR